MRTHDPSEPLGASMARARFDAPREFNVPLFRSLIDKLAEDRRWVILDLGAARPQTIALFSRFRCRMEIADLTDAAAEGSGDAIPFTGLPDALDGARNEEPVDLALCWDVLNYLTPEQMMALMTSVAARCRPGALLHALIAYSDELMPRRPGQFAPIDERRLISLSTSKPQRPAPRYSSEDLTSWMPGFTIERVRLLTNGMQEYLFRAR